MATRGDELGGVLMTGDLASRDEAGILSITGRASRMIKLFGTRVNLDDIDAHLASMDVTGVAFGQDDALRVLIEVARRLGTRLSRPVQTVTAGLVLLGIEPFFRAFSDLPTLEDKLAQPPGALAGALALVEQSHRAARLAAAFAVHRQDDDAEALHQAALLTQFGG